MDSDRSFFDHSRTLKPSYNISHACYKDHFFKYISKCVMFKTFPAFYWSAQIVPPQSHAIG